MSRNLRDDAKDLMDTLEEFIQSNRNPRELKRALAVQMSQRGHTAVCDSIEDNQAIES